MDPLAPLITNFLAEGRPRVWSLIITVFGDSVQHRGGQIATVRLARLLGRIGIEQGAVRTALSRLSKDGWVESIRTGRTSTYHLSAKGGQEYEAATRRIYAAPVESHPDTWSLSFQGDRPGFDLNGFTLRPFDGHKDGAFQLDGQLNVVSRDIVEHLLKPDHIDAIHRLRADLATLDSVAFDPLDAAAARTLLVHRWRRMVLRYPEIPPALCPSGSDASDLRARVAQAYRALTPQAEGWLDMTEGEMPAMPDADASLGQRFKSGQIA